MKLNLVNETYLGKDCLPVEEGVYLAIGVWGDKKPREIDVYRDQINRLSVFSEDYGGEIKFGIDDSTDCHVPVQNTGLRFICKVGKLK